MLKTNLFPVGKTRGVGHLYTRRSENASRICDFSELFVRAVRLYPISVDVGRELNGDGRAYASGRFIRFFFLLP